MFSVAILAQAISFTLELAQPCAFWFSLFTALQHDALLF